MNWQTATAITFFGAAIAYPLSEPLGFAIGVAFLGCFVMWVRNP